MNSLAQRWHSECGYREVLKIALPLIFSTGAFAIQQFVDRVFLTWYSPESIAAAMPAGILNFTIISFFMGTATYVNTFVAQYYGAKLYRNIGHIVWQGVYVAFIGSIVLLFISPFARQIFSPFGHDKLVIENEIIYFQVLCYGGFPVIANAALGAFYSGRGKTMPIMMIRISQTILNIIFDYILIFGKFGFPEMGIKGAALATILSSIFSMAAYFFLLAKSGNNTIYNTLKGWKFDYPLFKRLLKYGVPNGVQFCMDIAGFTTFILLVGRLGTVYLAASNIAFNINTLAFMPMIGFGITVSVLVGQNITRRRIDRAEKAVTSAFHLTFFYMATLAAFYVLIPDIFLKIYGAGADDGNFEQIREIAVILLRFVAVYSLFDTLIIIYSSAIKGAGDTRFVMVLILILSSLFLVIPAYTAIIVLNCGIYTAWTIVTGYIVIMGIAFLIRYLGGKWKSMQVIEEIPV